MNTLLLRLRDEDVKLGKYLLKASPLALFRNEQFLKALEVRNGLAQALTAAQIELNMHQGDFRTVGNKICKDEEGPVLTPIFDGLLRSLLLSVDSAFDASSKREELVQHLELLQQLAERSGQLLMTSGTGWGVSPVKIDSRINELAGELGFIKQTEPSRRLILEKSSEALFEHRTTQTWLQSEKSVEALVSAE
jgi:hypothetical protein